MSAHQRWGVSVCVCVRTHIFTDNQLLFGLWAQWRSSSDGRGAFFITDMEMAQDVCSCTDILPGIWWNNETRSGPSYYGHINKFTYDCRHANTNMHISAHSELSAYISIFCSFVSIRSLLSYFLLCLHIWSRELSAQTLSPGSCFLFLKFSVSLHNNLLHYMVTFI